MTAEVPAIAGRPVPVACAPGAGLGNPACYIPGIPVIEVDGKLLGADPGDCDPASPADRERYPVTWGALIHECAHAAHTSESLPMPQRANWCTAANELEESRIEARQASRRPGDRRWLRATATRLILADFTAAGADPGTPREAGLAAALLLAREDAGILEPGETKTVTAKVEAVIGPVALARLRATWREVHRTADGDMRAMTRLARRWCRILGIDPDAAPPAPVETASPTSSTRSATPSRRSRPPSGPTSPRRPPSRPAQPKARAREGRAEATPTRQPARSSARRPRPRAVTGHPRPPPRRGRRRPPPRPRPPRRHRRRARQGHHHLEGPARPAAHGQGTGRQAAQRAAGAVPTAEPFTRTRSRRVPAPPLRVGIACDISGSMGAFAGPVASAAWILARAAAYLPSAQTATVLFGKAVHALTRPGESPAKVTDFSAPDGTEKACRAIDALDGALGLSRPGTARLLVIVTDAHFVAEGEPAGAQQRITRLPAPAAASSSSPPRATPAPAASPTARSSRPPTPPTPSTPSPAPPPAPSPPDTRPGAGRPARPSPREKEPTAMTAPPPPAPATTSSQEEAT